MEDYLEAAFLEDEYQAVLSAEIISEQREAEAEKNLLK